MGKISQHAAHQAHAFPTGERVKGIRAQIHGHQAELHPLNSGGWQAIVPDLPGCVADGETMVEAASNVAGAIAAWLEAAEELAASRPAANP